MKRVFLLLVCTAMIAVQSYGSKFAKYPGFYYYLMSPDGKWLSMSSDGIAVMFNTADSTYYIYEGDEVSTSYNTGYGNAVNNLGMVMGATDNYTPAYWQDGEWTNLPLPEGERKGMYSTAHGVTPDGNYIVGCVSTGNFGDADSRTTYFPALWSRGADGTFSTCEVLPHPTKDFSGRAPQYITALCISDDGCTVAGQIMSNDGFTTYPIIYSKDSEGTWSYKTVGVDKVFDTSVELPPYPNYEPKYPNYSDYMDDAAKSAYEAAVDEYYDLLDQYYQGLISDYPTYPSQKDYLTDVDGYNAAMDKYNEEYPAYSDSLYVWEDAYSEALTGASFVYNTVMMSANGKYLGQTIQTPDPDADPLDWMSANISAPALFNLATGEYSQVEAKDMCCAYVTNDGTVFGGSPATELTRNAYAVEPGSTVAVPFSDYAAKKWAAAGQWIADNMKFDVTVYTVDPDTYDYNETVVEDSIVTGTLVSNPEGTRFATYLYNYWAEDEDEAGYISYFIDTTDADGIATIKRNGEADITVTAADGMININGNLSSVNIYDISGRLVSTAASTALGSGIYTVKATDKAGNTVTRKLCVKK